MATKLRVTFIVDCDEDIDEDEIEELSEMLCDGEFLSDLVDTLPDEFGGDCSINPKSVRVEAVE